VAEQLADPYSVLNYVSDLIALRQATPALGVEGEWKYVGDIDNPYPMIYARTLGSEKYIVVFNPSDRTVVGTVPAMGKSAEWIFGNNCTLAKCKTTKSDHTFTMKPISVAIFKMTK
jgi:maltose alpha-D-glucosyltransferase/alpha-amylase